MAKFNFDAPRGNKDAVIGLVRHFFEASRDAHRYKREEFQRIYDMYRQYQDLTNRDQYRSNFFMPFMYWMIESMAPVEIDALLGVRPYIPIEANQRQFSDISDAQTLLLDTMLEGSNFYLEMLKTIKLSIAYGMSAIEARPVFNTVTRTVQEPILMHNIDGTAQVVGQRPKTITKRLLDFAFTGFMPWNIYPDPNAKNLDDARALIKFRGLISKRQVKALVEKHPKGFPDFDLDKLKPAMDQLREENWSRKMAQDIGVTMPEDDDDLGVWLSYESPERLIDTWNFGVVMRDIDNEFNHKTFNLSRVINMVDINDFSEWFGIGEGKALEMIQLALNKSWNQTFDNHEALQHGVVAYDEEMVDVEELSFVGGNRIAVNKQPGQSFEEAFWERPQQQLPSDHYLIPNTIERMGENTSGFHRPSRGETDVKTKTAREAILTKAGDDIRMKLKIVLMEKMGLGDLAEKLISHVEQFATVSDIVERIGVEQAMTLPSVNPALLEGGFTFAMKGSDRTAESQIKRQDAKDLYQLMVGRPTIRQDWLSKFVLNRYEVPEQDQRKAILPDEQMFRIMAIMAQMGISSGQGGGGASTRLLSTGQTVGAQPGEAPSGRDQSEKLSLGI